MSNKVTQHQVGSMPFAARYLAKLRYCQTGILNTPATGTSNLATTFTWQINSCFKPCFSAAGHQPYQFDQLTPLYGKYRVYKVDWKVVLRNEANSSATGGIITQNNIWGGVSVLTNANVAGGQGSASGFPLDTIRERSTTACRELPTSPNRENWGVIRGSTYMPTMFGLSKDEFKGNITETAAAVTANPTKLCFIEVFVVDPTNVANLAPIQFDVEFIMHTEFFEYKSPAQS